MQPRLRAFLVVKMMCSWNSGEILLVVVQSSTLSLKLLHQQMKTTCLQMGKHPAVHTVMIF